MWQTNDYSYRPFGTYVLFSVSPSLMTMVLENFLFNIFTLVTCEVKVQFLHSADRDLSHRAQGTLPQSQKAHIEEQKNEHRGSKS